ncbi:TonB-dependent receptor [Rhodohalobacter mucosus]|uniref:Uncharacterized protein n=1 Tax=Rhodohalobacter mucosus TaxID=2079485 RepID=A0A316TSU1_9BACT|nr:TonB-dependent receptor [Rhodohalobacter mucosus]PWN05312.1 hypothetical protein DDZ15_14665 [Rhodohalobacter mucosus]
MTQGISFRTFWIAILLSLGVTLTLRAQESAPKSPLQFEFSGESMINVLDRIARDTEIDLVYDPELIRNITVYKRLRHPTVTELLTDLLQDYRLDYITLSSGTIVIVRASRETPSFGTVSGLVVDSDTGEPLPGATVLLADASGGTSTNHHGRFAMNRLMSGTHHLIISYMGYESAFRTIRIEPNRSLQERIVLTPRPIDVEPIVVHAHRSRLPSTNSGGILNVQSEGNRSGFTGGPIRSLSLLSGVQYGLPMKDLNLQGSDQGEHRITLDGIPVYNPYSFGKLFSSFSPYAIGNVTLHKAGYGTAAGSTTAGLVELKHDIRPNSPNRLTLQTDPSYVNLRGDLSLPVSETRSLKMLGALRTSYWDLQPDPFLKNTLRNWDRLDPLITNALMDLEVDAGRYKPLEHRSDLSTFDLHAAVLYEPDDFSRLLISAYAAKNRIETGLLNEQTFDPDVQRYLYAVDGHQWSNSLIQAQWSRMLTPRLDLSLQAGYSENHFDHVNRAGLSNSRPSDLFFRSLGSSASLDSASPETSQPLPTRINGNTIQHLQLNADAGYSLSPVFSLQGGIRAEQVYSNVSISEPATMITGTDQHSTIIGSYLNAEHQAGRNWRLSYGTRITWLDTTNDLYAEPRFSIQYDQPSSRAGYWSLRVAGGLYRQFINEYRITNTGPTAIVPDIPIWSHTGNTAIPKAWHLTASLLIEPSERASVTAELFHKWHPEANFTTYIESDNLSGTITDVSAFGITTEMQTWGAGIRYSQYFFDESLRLTAGYDYSFAEISLEEQFGSNVSTPWNEPHRAQLSALWRITSNLSLVTGWQGIWGRKWGYRRAYYNFLLFDESTAELSSRFSNPDRDKLPAFLQTDITFVWQPSLRIADLELRAGLVNLMNRKNVLETYLVPVYENDVRTGYEEEYRTMPGIYPVFSFSIDL